MIDTPNEERDYEGFCRELEALSKKYRIYIYAYTSELVPIDDNYEFDEGYGNECGGRWSL